MTEANDNNDQFQTGAQLLADWECLTREQKLERACKALLPVAEYLHIEANHQSLLDNVNNKEVVCSCADAYRMGVEALKKPEPTATLKQGDRATVYHNGSKQFYNATIDHVMTDTEKAAEEQY